MRSSSDIVLLSQCVNSAQAGRTPHAPRRELPGPPCMPATTRYFSAADCIQGKISLAVCWTDFGSFGEHVDFQVRVPVFGLVLFSRRRVNDLYSISVLRVSQRIEKHTVCVILCCCCCWSGCEERFRQHSPSDDPSKVHRLSPAPCAPLAVDSTRLQGIEL